MAEVDPEWILNTPPIAWTPIKTVDLGLERIIAQVEEREEQEEHYARMEPEYPEEDANPENWRDCWGDFDDIQLVQFNDPGKFQINIDAIEGYYYTENQLMKLRRFIDYALGQEGIAIDLDQPF